LGFDFFIALVWDLFQELVVALLAVGLKIGWLNADMKPLDRGIKLP
jgi:hypothetical protein